MIEYFEKVFSNENFAIKTGDFHNAKSDKNYQIKGNNYEKTFHLAFLMRLD